MVMLVRTLSTGETKAGGSQVQGNLGYLMSPAQKKVHGGGGGI
jgi:hypothetical protein